MRVFFLHRLVVFLAGLAVVVAAGWWSGREPRLDALAREAPWFFSRESPWFLSREALRIMKTALPCRRPDSRVSPPQESS